MMLYRWKTRADRKAAGENGVTISREEFQRMRDELRAINARETEQLKDFGRLKDGGRS